MNNKDKIIYWRLLAFVLVLGTFPLLWSIYMCASDGELWPTLKLSVAVIFALFAAFRLFNGARKIKRGQDSGNQ
jgi:hypothetical protein